MNRSIKTYILLAVVTILCNQSFAQKMNPDSIWVMNNYYKIERSIPMRDGVKLFTSIYIPKDSTEKHPILLTRTPYSCQPYGEKNFSRMWRSSSTMPYLKNKYIIVKQDVRGKYMSEGQFVDVRPYIADKKSNKDVDEASDSYDAIDWLVKNVPYNNGNVGVFGVSYPGFYSTMAALCGHPALKAVSPQAPVTDWFVGDDTHHKGVLFILDEFDFDHSFGVPRRKLMTEDADVAEVPYDDNYAFFLTGTFSELDKKYMGDTIAFWRELAKHPDYDNWWKERNAAAVCKNIKPAIMVTGGLFDAEDLYGTWSTYQSIKKQSPQTNSRIVMGPWNHGGWRRTTGAKLGNVWFGGATCPYYINKIELPFFNYYLKGEGNLDSLADATVFITGENKWHSFAEWPPKGITATDMYLQDKGKLSFEKPTETNSSDSYISDPMKPVPYSEAVKRNRTIEYMSDDQRFAARRPDVLVYEMDTLQNDITLTGPVVADIFTSISTTDDDFVVKLIDVFPDNFTYPDSAGIKYPMGGYQMLVRAEIMRGRYRNSFEKPEPFVPNQISEVKFTLPDVAHTFKKGHRIMIQIQSTWFPLADRNPQQFVNPYTCLTKDLIKSEIHIYHDKMNSSKIVLPILK